MLTCVADSPLMLLSYYQIECFILSSCGVYTSYLLLLIFNTFTFLPLLIYLSLVSFLLDISENSEEQEQTPHNAASDQVLDCLLA